MQIEINGTIKEIKQEGSSVAAMLSLENISQYDGLAVAVNNTVVPRGDWENFQIKDNDKILIIRAAQGG